VPYYGAQWLLFYRATCVALSACSCISQEKWQRGHLQPIQL
jgi:hypothetical protein